VPRRLHVRRIDFAAFQYCPEDTCRIVAAALNCRELDSRARRSGPYTKPKRGELRTLADARAYILKRKPGTTDRAWQHAMNLMIEAAEEGDAEAVTKQLELALADRRGIMDGA
jgi:hypothetical protein